MNISHTTLLFAACFLAGALAEPARRNTKSPFRKDIHILLYDQYNDSEDSTSSVQFVKDRSGISSIRTTVYGGTLKDRGSGDKLRLLKPILEVANANELMVVADAKEVVLNVPPQAEAASHAVDAFLAHFHKMTEEHPHAVVFSAEEGCCSAAMSHSSPGDYFDVVTQERKHRACTSGAEDCRWEDNQQIASWKEAMGEKAIWDKSTKNVYLNTGILAGYPKDLLELLRVSDIDAHEDDQAVLTDLMLVAPDMIQLDYRQELFGTNSVHKGLENGCVYERDSIEQPLMHVQHMTRPLFLHTPNKFYDCLDTLIRELGGTSQQRYLVDFGDGDEGMARRLVAFADDEEKDHRELEETDAMMTNDGYGMYLPLNYGVWTPYGVFQAILPTNIGISGSVFGEGGYMDALVKHMFGKHAVLGTMFTMGNYGVFFGPGNYGVTFWMGPSNYGQYGNYGNYGYGSFDSRTQGLRGSTTGRLDGGTYVGVDSGLNSGWGNQGGTQTSIGLAVGDEEWSLSDINTAGTYVPSGSSTVWSSSTSTSSSTSSFSSSSSFTGSSSSSFTGSSSSSFTGSSSSSFTGSSSSSYTSSSSSSYTSSSTSTGYYYQQPSTGPSWFSNILGRVFGSSNYWN